MRNSNPQAVNARKPALPRRIAALALASSIALASLFGGAARAQHPSLIRDAEIEGLLKAYARPILDAAGIPPGTVRVHIVNSNTINAFVADGQRIFIHTGLLLQADTPNAVIGVLAHETGHIAGGHLARLGRQLDKASTAAIIGMLIGAAAMVGGGVAGNAEAARGGQGVIMGSQATVMRSLLSYMRAQESAADQAALSYLHRTGQSGAGMIKLFNKLANQSLASTRFVDPYVVSHPMPLDRVRNLETEAQKSPNFAKQDAPELQFRHKMMQAKLYGFLNGAQLVYQKYPTSDTSPPARYARAILAFRTGDLRNSLKEIDALLAAMPNNPYIWELKGQALHESGREADAVAVLLQAVKTAPNSPLIRLLLAQAMLGTEDQKLLDPAIENLKLVERAEPGMPLVHRQLAVGYGRKGDIGMADLETAEAAVHAGDIDLAKRKAKTAQARLQRSAPAWLRANDILNYEKPKE